jgi:hypothetical protein
LHLIEDPKDLSDIYFCFHNVSLRLKAAGRSKKAATDMTTRASLSIMCRLKYQNEPDN